METKVLNSFKKKMGKEVKGLDLMVGFPDDFDDEYCCTVMETRDNGKVWEVKCTKNLRVTDVYEL